jgi:hypothetical protein
MDDRLQHPAAAANLLLGLQDELVTPIIANLLL